MKKIAVIGSHGVGKSTLCNCLATYVTKKGMTSVNVAENVRDCPLPIHKEQGLDTTLWILGRQIQAEMEATIIDPEYIFCDRSVIDPLIYLLYNSQQDLSDELVHFVKDYASKYDKIILIRPAARAIEADMFRNTDKNYQYLIHSLFVAFCIGWVDVIDSKSIFNFIENGDDSFVTSLLEV